MAETMSAELKDVKAFFDEFANLEKQGEKTRRALLEISDHSNAILEHSRAISGILAKLFPKGLIRVSLPNG